MQNFFGPDYKSGFGRFLVRLCLVSASVFLVLGGLGNISTEHISPFIVTVLSYLFLASMIVFAITFIALGARAVGRSADKKTWASQARFTLGHTFLFLILPCLLFAIGAVIWMLFNGRL